MRQITVYTFLHLFLFWAIPWAAMTDTIRICWLGSSSRADTPHDLAILAAERGVATIRSYYPDATTSWTAVLERKALMDTIRSGVFDYVIMMAMGDSDFYGNGKKLADSIKAAGSLPVVWVRRGEESSMKPLVFDTLTLRWSQNWQDTLNERNLKLADTAGIYAAPDAVSSQVLVKHGIRIFSDGIHPSEEQKYMQACVFEATLFRENPTGRLYNPNTTFVDSVVAHFLQQSAWNCVMEERMKKYLPPWNKQPMRVKQINLSDNPDSIECYLTFKIDADLIYENDSVENNTVNAVYSTLTPNVASVDFFGHVTGKRVGKALIEIWRETEHETLSVNITPSTAILDSISVLPKTLTGYAETGFKFTALGYFHKDNQYFSTNIDGLVNWISSDTTRFKVVNGYLTRMGGEGGNLTLTVEKDGFQDSTHFTLSRKLSMIRRINFQPTDSVFSPLWDWEMNRNYDASRGYGWVSNNPSWSNMGIAKWMIDLMDTCYLLATSVAPGEYQQNSEGRFKLGVVDGDYILKICVGSNTTVRLDDDPLVWNYSGPGGSDTLGSDTLCNPATTAYVSSNPYLSFRFIDTLKLRTNSGLHLNIRGTIKYLVLISKEGVNIDSVAYDTKEALRQTYGGTRLEKEKEDTLGLRADLIAVPNPFNPAVTLFVKSTLRPTSFGAYNTSGRKVADLLPLLKSGSVLWTPNLPAGIYYIRLETSGKRIVRSIVLIK